MLVNAISMFCKFALFACFTGNLNLNFTVFDWIGGLFCSDIPN